MDEWSTLREPFSSHSFLPDIKPRLDDPSLNLPIDFNAVLETLALICAREALSQLTCSVVEADRRPDAPRRCAESTSARGKTLDLECLGGAHSSGSVSDGDGPQGRTTECQEEARPIGIRKRQWGKWAAEIMDPSLGKRRWLGTFNSEGEAIRAYTKAKREIKEGKVPTLKARRRKFPRDSGGSEQSPNEAENPFSSRSLRSDPRAIMLQQFLNLRAESEPLLRTSPELLSPFTHASSPQDHEETNTTLRQPGIPQQPLEGTVDREERLVLGLAEDGSILVIPEFSVPRRTEREFGPG